MRLPRRVDGSRSPATRCARSKLARTSSAGSTGRGAGEYTSAAVEALCDALSSEACQLQDLRIFGNCWGNKDAHKLAAALAKRSKPLAMLDMRWNEMGSDAVEALLTAATPTCNVEHLPQRLRCGATLNAHTNWVETLQHDDTYMYSGSQDQTIRKWRRSDLHCEAVLKGHEKGVLSLKLLGDMLYAGDRKGEIKLWKVGPGEDQHQCKGTLSGHKGAIWMLQYDEECGRLYSCCDDKKVICWDVAQLRQIKTFDGHKDKVYREVLFLDDRLTPEGGHALCRRLDGRHLPMGRREEGADSVVARARGLGVGHVDGVVCAHLRRPRRHGQAVGPARTRAHPTALQAQLVGLLLLGAGQRLLLVCRRQHHQGVGLEGWHVPRHDARPPRDRRQPLPHAGGYPLLLVASTRWSRCGSRRARGARSGTVCASST